MFLFYHESLHSRSSILKIYSRGSFKITFRGIIKQILVFSCLYYSKIFLFRDRRLVEQNYSTNPRIRDGDTLEPVQRIIETRSWKSRNFTHIYIILFNLQFFIIAVSDVLSDVQFKNLVTDRVLSGSYLQSIMDYILFETETVIFLILWSPNLTYCKINREYFLLSRLSVRPDLTTKVPTDPRSYKDRRDRNRRREWQGISTTSRSVVQTWGPVPFLLPPYLLIWCQKSTHTS